MMKPTPPPAKFARAAVEVHQRHRRQSPADVAALTAKYAATPAVGVIKVSEAVLLLDRVVDPTDPDLYQVTQWGHVCQVMAMMEAERVVDEGMLVVGLVHDLGKVLLLSGEAPENVVCDNLPVGDPSPGAGLANVTFQWNHDEFGYMRFKDHLPDALAKLIRYHSINPTSIKYLGPQDKNLYELYLSPFRRFDKASKSVQQVPPVDVDKYLALLDRWFPEPILL